MFPRFDSVIEYHLPSGALTRQVLRNRLANVKMARLDRPKIGRAAEGLSHADLSLAAERAA